MTEISEASKRVAKEERKTKKKFFKKFKRKIEKMGFAVVTAKEIKKFEKRMGLRPPTGASAKRRIKDSRKQVIFKKDVNDHTILIFTTWDPEEKDYTTRNSFAVLVSQRVPVSKGKKKIRTVFYETFRRNDFGLFLEKGRKLAKFFDYIFSTENRPLDGTGKQMDLFSDKQRNFEWRSNLVPKNVKPLSLHHPKAKVAEFVHEHFKQREYYARVRRGELMKRGDHKGGYAGDLRDTWNLKKPENA